MTHRQIVRAGALVVVGAMVASACGGGSSSTPTGPSTTGGNNAPPPANANANVTVNITGTVGSQAFTPNPVAIVEHQTLGFRNSDSTVHRIVADGGSFDSGNIQPGASSTPVMIMTANPIPFHCAIHPGMVGTINSTGTGPGVNDPSTQQPGY
jgi:plastocyanin